MARFRMTATAFTLVLVAALAAAEAWRPADGGDTRLLEVALASSLESFDGCEQFLDTVRGEALARVTPWGLEGTNGAVAMFDMAVREDAADMAEATVGGGEGFAVGGAGGSAGDAAALAPRSTDAAPVPIAADGDGGAVEVSGTNVQEGGVDEPDIVKTDGRVLAAVARGRLQLVDLTGADPRLAAELPLEDGWGHELLLHGERLLITANGHEEGAQPEPDTDSAGGSSVGRIMPAPMGRPFVRLTLLDIADPAQPRTIGTVRMDGHLVSSRLVDRHVRLVLRSQPQPALTHPAPAPEPGPAELREAEDAALERNREVVERSRASDWLPTYAVADDAGVVVERAPLVACDEIRHPAEFRGFGMLSVLALDLTGDLTPTGAASVLGDGDTVYATPDRLFVAMNRWEEGPVPAPGGTGAESVPDVMDGDETSVEQPDAWIDAPAEPMPPGFVPPAMRTSVEIHEFDTTDPAHPVYTASGSVPGHLLNQWALSWHDGHLRVATTTEGFETGGTSESGVHVLRREGARLVEVGAVTGLGKDERIFAVRYFGPVGFVVTFRQTDPLYTLDLSDPAQPRMLGELKIPGFSSYLHPLGQDLLLGVGQDADEQTGQRLGVQVSLFDVADLTDPRRMDVATFDRESMTEVEHDHRAFLWWPAERRVILPYQHWRWDAEGGDAGFYGALALDVDAGIREAGRLSHVDGATPDPYFGQIRRAVVVGDTLYTMSELGLMASGVADLDRRGWLPFAGPEPGDVVEEIPAPEALSLD